MAKNIHAVRFDEWLKVRLLSELPGYSAQIKMTKNVTRPTALEAPVDARNSAVIMLIGYKEDQPQILLIKRAEYNGAHSGQMAFPGGKWEESDASLYHTALREAHEEISADADNIQYVGALTPLYIPVSNFVLHPFIAFDSLFDYKDFSAYEVASVHYYNLEEIYNSKQDVDLDLPFYNARIHTSAYVPNDGNIIWGASAMVLSELEELYNEYLIEVNSL